MKLSNFILSIAALSMHSKAYAKDYSAETVCNIAFASYMAGCVDVYVGPKHSDKNIIEIVSKCLAKAEKFTKAIDDCSQAKFEKLKD